MTTDADRQLMFGLLALQNGMINQSQLLAAFQAWRLDQTKSLADHLEDGGDLPFFKRALLEVLAEVHLEAHGGVVARSLAAISAGKSTCESLTSLGDADIEGTLSHVASAHDSTNVDAERTASYASGAGTSDGQRFRILRPHARGGLGAVFVALDSELHREVALKQILDQHADDPTSRQRFLIEAEITGGLEHPGIVPVYGLGTYGDGRPYYAMRFIKGESLKEAIERFHAADSLKSDPGRRSLERRKLLRRFTDVCNAIDYAHSRGVLHRDIKPGNVIVGKHGETLVVDWGLAKTLQRVEPTAEAGERALVPSSGSGGAETLPGSALGTPAYMSPEQARGELERLGPWSDVYSLGSTLYCLLTGKPPYVGDDVFEILRKVQIGEFAAPRQVDRSLDKALECVCLKAMATKPEDRYPTPKVLADDLERWMADEPVTAWSEPWTRKLLRWLTRHRTGVTGAAAAVLVGVVGLSAVLAVQAQANGRLSESLKRETAAKVRVTVANADLKAAGAVIERANADLAAANDRAEARYKIALDAIKTFHTGVSEDFLLKEPQFKTLRDRLLKSATGFYEKLGALLGKESDVASRRALATARAEIARLTADLGEKVAALALYREALAVQEALAAEPGADPETKVDLGRTLLAISRPLGMTGKTDDQFASIRRAEALMVEAERSSPSSTAVKDALASCRAYVGNFHLEANQWDAALVAYRQARAHFEARTREAGATAEMQHELAAVLGNIAVLLNETGKHQEAEAEYRAALATNQKLIDAYPTSGRYRDHQAVILSNRAENLLDLGRSNEAEAEYRAALALWQALAQEYPAVTAWQNNLGFLRINLGEMLQSRGQSKAAEADFRAAQAVLRKVADEHPNSVSPRANLANSTLQLARALLSLGRRAEARDEADRAVTLFRSLVEASPRSVNPRMGLGLSLLRAGEARRALGDHAGAVGNLRQAIASCEALPAQVPQRAFIEACCRAQLYGLPGREGSGLSATAGDTEATAAIRALRAAARAGYPAATRYRTETALDTLRDRPDFQILMMDRAFPSDPFSPGTRAHR